MKNIALHWQIIIGLILGLAYGLISTSLGWGIFTTQWIAPFGIIFINLLKLIAVPLVLSSLITGVASLSDLKKLSRIGGKTISIYIVTTAIAVTIGLVSVNILKPGNKVPQATKEQLQQIYEKDASSRTGKAKEVQTRGPLQPFVDMVPSNFFSSAASNRNMLQVVFIAIFLGLGLIQIPKDKGKPVLTFFQSLNDIIIKLVDLIMLIAPIGVFSLIAQTINKKSFEFSKESKENGELYGSIKPKEISNKILEKLKVEVKPSQILIKENLDKIGNYNVDINLHSEVSAKIIIKINKIQSS